MSTLACALAGTNNERVALCDVAIAATLDDLLSEVHVTQTYRNDEQVNIEAVYTFPLPLDAVLLDVKVSIAGRTLAGTVVEKHDAEAQYEAAMDRGDSAVMLEQLEPGLYTLNVGNILPRETATISYRYTMLYRWSGDRLRFFLPTTIAPRYGASPHAPHQLPEHSLTVENRFSLTLDVRGTLRGAQFSSPSHAVTLTQGEDWTRLSLTLEHAVMDRDFVLHVRHAHAARSFMLTGRDGDGVAAIASFQPHFPGLQQPRALNLAILIDCSGSMQGDSIMLARQALGQIIDALQPDDRVTLIAFGSTTQAATDRAHSCTPSHLARLRSFASALDANLGGTEVGTAMQDAYDALRAHRASDIFLVTDGQVAEWEEVISLAKRSGHRVFTVGVGSAVHEAFVRALASETNGACEMVSPREGMAERVMRHFERLRAPRATRVRLRWPEGARDAVPSDPGPLFEGDTIVASAHFDRSVASGVVTLEVETEGGAQFRQELAMTVPNAGSGSESLSTVARLAASMRLGAFGDAEGRATALRYRLASEWTNWLVVAERGAEEKADAMPALRKVPQTMAAGWGGIGSVAPMQKSRATLSRLDAMFSPAFSMPRMHLSSPARPSQPLPPAPPMEVFAPRVDLITLINVDPSRLAAGRLLELLAECADGQAFESLLHAAAALSMRAEPIAALLLFEHLNGPDGRSLSGSAKRQLRQLEPLALEVARQIDQVVSLMKTATLDPSTLRLSSLFEPGVAAGDWNEYLKKLRVYLAALQAGTPRLASAVPRPATR